ncbi:MAG: hypothetical protein CMP17_03555 [Rickettsiales bacterium]|nr:hypothetical protein [Rickettsiales bacterium]|tara:strand:- start:4913 stop:6394 length:1482 start_codon:yes stop_codon:yes gene_type:complete
MSKHKKPNLVFIMSDQQRYDTLACYGNDWINTPRLNELSDESFVFENAYVTQPVCAPARSSIMTGLYPHTAGPIVNKIPLKKDTKSIADLIENEYTCGYLGKWHLGDDTVKQRGFDEWVSVEDLYKSSYYEGELPYSDLHKWLESKGHVPTGIGPTGNKVFSDEDRSMMPEDSQMSTFLSEKAEDFIDRNKDDSFVLYVSTFEPHSPYAGPLDGMYDPEKIPTGPTFLKEPNDVSNINKARSAYHSSFLKGADQRSDYYMNNYLASRGEDFSTREGWLKARADYFANITLVDRMVGRIIDSLKKNNLYEDTILVFTSEHGEMMGDHGMLEKRTLYEESSKVPLLIKLPGVNGTQKKIKGSFGHIDLVPTLLSLMNQKQSDHLQGEDKSKSFETLNLYENVVVVEWNGTGEIDDRNLGTDEINKFNKNPRRSIIIDRMKLNLTLNDDGELFDLDLDPFEEKNLFHDEKYTEVIESMKNSLIKWQEINEDSFRFV